MESTRTLTELLLLLIAACVRGAFVEPLQPSTELLSYTDTQTRLPCHYKTAEGESVVQVTWNKELPDGTKEPIIMNHFSEGLRGFGRYADRVKFESFAPTTESSALLLPNTQESDEGVYSCHISTFPSGNFERRIKLTVWTLPISSLDPVMMVEGDPFGEVASCRAVGKPVPWLTWDTDLPGRTQNRTAESGAVSSRYFLHPLRSMNGKKLDCLVWHPGLEKPRRISNRLVVQYPPDPIISSPTSHWYVGLENAELLCEGRGNPEPQSVIWKRKGGVLPDGVAVVGDKLLFGRAVQLNDSGTYECTVKNTVGSEKTYYTLAISEKSHVPLKDNLLLIIIGTSAGVLVLVLVIVFLVVRRRNRRATKRLETELRRTRDQMDSLSRQASFRRLNSYSSVSRMQSEDYAIDSRAKYSQMSLDSGLPSSLVPLKVQPDDGNRHKEPDLGHLLEGDIPSSGDSPPGDDSILESSTTEGYEEEDVNGSEQLSKTLGKMFYTRNGYLRPIENRNVIFLPNNVYKPQVV
ncbi:nectin-4 isoform X2 [Fundulus heteroclitus]|uniref:nectin-4 isoform X2 n=1 Tax=Fundulus heteroclitus TaxID=8078 RepID=UPI00165C9933|nr:nectin-4 isoform X2 [Fundulus heteroclitus]